MTGSLTLKLTPDESVQFQPSRRPPVQVVAGQRTLTFNLGATPGWLKGTDGFLDPAKVRDVGLIFVFEGNLDWI